MTEADAQRYVEAYSKAIDALAARAHSDDLRENPGISVKLSALHPRYEATQQSWMLAEMQKRLLLLAQKAKAAGIGLNIDAEEADRLDLSLDVIDAVLSNASLKDWEGFGVVVQAYGPRALSVIDWLYDTAIRHDRRIMVRLVKGAYWDTEIKRAQVMGLSGYPVFTRKCVTDLSYLACAKRLLQCTDRIYPQFATHNAHTVAAVLAMAGEDRTSFEFQRLHGMGDALHDIVKTESGSRCRIYAPVGTHEDLLAYLVRRLLENGANSSFVNQIVDHEITPAEIASDPLEQASALLEADDSALALPAELFAPERRNSRGRDITDPLDLAAMEQGMSTFAAPHQWQIESSQTCRGEMQHIANPAEPGDAVGSLRFATSEDVQRAVELAQQSAHSWSATDVVKRAAIMRKAADVYEANAGELFTLLVREAGKTRDDAIAELREAVDFLRYYASRAVLAEHRTRARGVIVCISPWNFPLAIFTGQLSAALATGNAVIAKPAEQTPLVAMRAVQLLHQAGVPVSVLQLLPGDGESVGATLVANPGIAGVCFTGSTGVAGLINQQLAKTAPVDAMLVAETGGLNAMIVDSTALMEQAVRDIVQSAFQSAGQRCSALRIVYVQEEIRDRLVTMLSGAMDLLQVGDPRLLKTDVGPIIDQAACAHIREYCDRMAEQGSMLHQSHANVGAGFVSPTLIEVDGIDQMQEEIFGPVLHLSTFAATGIDAVIDAVNRSEYGLTFGLHTRIDQRVQHLTERVCVGNFYVNRNQIGAVVGSQPFGGEGLSGTGPKAGGAHYLRRFRLSLADDKARNTNLAVKMPELADASNFLQCLEHAAGQPLVHPEQQLVWLRKALRGRGAEAMAASAALDCGPVDLPGPTGESNQHSIAPLGTVVCLSHDHARLLDMVIQALRPGNQVIAVGNGAIRALSGLGGSGCLQVIDGSIADAWLEQGRVDAVAADASFDVFAIRQTLSRRQGPLVRLVTERIYPAAFGIERAICIDTTAAGGNAALLAEMV